VQAQPQRLDEKCKKLEETIQKMRQTPSATRENKQIKSGRGVCKGEQAKKRRPRASHPNQNQKSQECLQTSLYEREAFV
jgi:hypothetical protein